MSNNYTTPLYKLWINARYRSKQKGILEWSEEWNSFENFEKWALSNEYSKGCRLKRIDKTKPFQPNNCILLEGKTDYGNRLHRIHRQMLKSPYPVHEQWKQYPMFEVWAYENGYDPKKHFNLDIVRAYSYDSWSAQPIYMWAPGMCKWRE